MRLYKEICELEDQGIDLIELLGQDQHLRSPEELHAILQKLSHAGGDLHAELLFFLTHRQFTPAQAKSLWGAIQRHKRQMSERLGRTVKFRVAALDYLCSKNVQLRGVRIISKEDFDEILNYANVDEVTGVFTRRYFNEHLLLEVNRARRYGSSLSLLVLDLDNFKRINDEMGHIRGDAFLRRIGRTLQENTRQSDVSCRYGGDEFAVLLPETSNSEAYTLAERIRSAVCEAVREEFGDRGAQVLEIGASIGAATFPVDCDEADELVAISDRLCLDAKRKGKNAVRMSGEEGGKGRRCAVDGDESREQLKGGPGS